METLPFADSDACSTKNDNNSRTTTNFMILSESGKPIFVRYGTDEQVSQMCGVVQGLRASVLYDTDLNLGDLGSLETSHGTRIVFWHVKGLTLVAISSSMNEEGGTEAYLRFVLETLYCQLAFSLTQPVLDSLALYPNLGAEDIMGNSERHLHAMLDQLDLFLQDENKDGKQSTITTTTSGLALVNSVACGALQPLHPLSSAVREEASQVLREVGDETPDTLFAFLFVQPNNNNKNGDDIRRATCSSRLVTWVQRRDRGLQIRAADATLLLFFLSRQSASLVASESLWLPVCLPRFNASGFVYCYAKCLDRETGLCLGLTSHLGTTEQFQLFQQAATAICNKLSIPVAQMNTKTQNMVTVKDLTVTTETTQACKVAGNDNDAASDQDYVDASGDGDRIIPYVAAKGLVEEVALSLNEIVVSKLHALYLEICQAVHFVFRYDVSLPRNSRRVPSRLPQCLCVGDGQHFETAASHGALWSTYDKLMMRLRLGSTQSESIQDAIRMIAQDRQAKAERPVHLAVDYECHAAALLEAPPDFAGMTSECQGEFRHVGINGEAFELYFTVSSELSVKQATASGAKLVRRLLMDQQTLFLSNPMTWRK